MGDTVGRGDSEPAPARASKQLTRFSSGKPMDLDGDLGDILRRRSLRRSAAGDLRSSRPSRTSSLKEFNIFKKSITYDSQYKEYEEDVVFVEPNFKVKRIVSPQGELMLSALAGVSRQIEVLAMLPEIMSRLVYGDIELERVLGEATVEAILRLYFVQVHWIEHRNVGDEPFQPFGVSLTQIKRRLQKGARYPIPQSKRKSIRLILQESLAEEVAGEDVDGEEDEYEGEEEFRQVSNPAPTSSSFLGSSIPPTVSGSLPSVAEQGYGIWVTPAELGISTERYMSDVVQAGYRQVFRLLTTNQSTMTYLAAKIQPEVTQAVKVLYSQIHVLEGLMYVKFLVTPEEEIQKLQHLKQIWVKEQRLLREYRALEEEFEELGNNREKIMRTLSASINSLIVQIDTMCDYSRYEVNKISAEGNKQGLVNTKKFDQDVQQLDGNFQSALKFAMKLRANYAEIENEWRKQREKLEGDLEALISEYDSAMKAKQEDLDDKLMTEEVNRLEIVRLEEVNRKVEKRYAQFLDETRVVRKVRKRSKKKKKGKGKKGKKKRGRSGKSKGRSGKSKSQSKSKGKGQGSKSKKGKKKSKKGKKTEEAYEEDNEEFIDDSEEEEESSVMKKQQKKRKSKKGAREVNDLVPNQPPLGDDIIGEEEGEGEEEDENEMHRVEALAKEMGTKITKTSKQKKGKKKKRSKSTKNLKKN